MVQKGLRIAFSAALVLAFGMEALAADPGALYSTDTQDDQIVAYIQNPGQEEITACQIGTEICKDITVSGIAEEEVPLRTLVLLDNSLSVTEQYRPMIQQILLDVVANRMDREQFSVAVFSEQANYLAQNTSDYAELKNIIDGITYQNQETYLTDVLYEVLQAGQKEENSIFQRIIIISDGVDNKYIGYAKEELYDLIRANPCPIYTIGCTYKDNGEQLKNMFMLSRMTYAKSWLLDDVGNSMDLVKDMDGDKDVVRVVIKPDPAICDGSIKGLKLNFGEGEQSVEVTAEIRLPFAEALETTEPETTKAAAPAVEENPPEVPQKKGINPYFIMICGVIGVLLLGGGVLLFWLKKKKASDSEFESLPDDVRSNSVSDEHEPMTERVNNTEDGDNPKTQSLWSDSRSYTLALLDQQNLARTFEVPLRETVVIGRSKVCQIVIDYDKSVSGQHCEIVARDGKFYIRDLQSSNGTLLNGNRVLTEAEVYSGCILTLGRLKLKIEIH